MRTITRLLTMTVFLASVAPVAGAPASEILPPVARAARHFDDGAAFLRALPDGTVVRVLRADGSAFELRLAAGVLRADIAPSALEPGAAFLRSPLGWRVGLRTTDDGLRALFVEAPNGAWTAFHLPRPDAVFATTRGGRSWSARLDAPLALRLADGTRLDIVADGAACEALTLRGERFRLDLAGGTWQAVESGLAPPLVADPGVPYVTTGGETWKRPAGEDHVVFGWNWYPAGLPVERALDEVGRPPRRAGLDALFRRLERAQPPADLAAALLGRRLALTGGDQVVFEVPGAAPRSAFLLPGPADPPAVDLRNELGGRGATLPVRRAPKPPVD